MIYVIMGPTCSGKTEVANRLIDKLNCEAINFDAFQIYKDMDIGTSKLEKSDPHYSRYKLLDIISPSESFSVMEYQSLARDAINESLKKHKDVVMVGGTGLYVRAALYDYKFLKEEEIDNSDLEELTNEELFDLLTKLDIEATNKIHINNRKRLIRAISMVRNSGVKKSELIASQEHKLIYDNVRFLFLSPDREKLYENINSRVLEMIDKGLVNEVKSLLDKYQLSITASQGIGYKEIIDFLHEKITLVEAIELIQKRTRNYAKRQVTFFKNQFDYELFTDKEELIKSIGE